MPYRVGIGFDIHRLVEDRPLILGGVTIPYHKGLLGHSDGDVVIHAVCDAILGAVSTCGHRGIVPGHLKRNRGYELAYHASRNPGYDYLAIMNSATSTLIASAKSRSWPVIDRR